MKKLFLITLVTTLTYLCANDSISFFGINIGQKFEGIDKKFVDDTKGTPEFNYNKYNVKPPQYSYNTSSIVKPFSIIKIYTTPITNIVYKIDAISGHKELDNCKNIILGIIQSYGKKFNTEPKISKSIFGFDASIEVLNTNYNSISSIDGHCMELSGDTMGNVQITDNYTQRLYNKEKKLFDEQEKLNKQKLLDENLGDKTLNNLFVN